MKVKGIESARRPISDFRFLVPAFWFLSQDEREPANESRRKRTFLIACLLALSVLVPTALADAIAAAPQAQITREQTYRDARKALRKGDYEQTLNLYKDLMARDGQDILAQNGAAYASMKMQSYGQCYDYGSAALKIDANNARAHALVGTALLHSGFLREAVPELREALRLDPKEPLAYGSASEFDYFEGRISEARAKALLAIRLDPNEPDYIMTYARASSRAEDYKEAADAYELFLQTAPLSDSERRERIQGLIRFYRRLAGIQVHQVSGPSRSEVSFRLGSDRRPYIRVKVNGREALFVIDTGAGFTVISKDSAKRLGISEIARGGKSQGIGGDGKFSIVYGLIGALQLNEVKVRMVPCFIRPFHGVNERPADERADGYIGLSILSRFIAEIDYQQGRLILDRNMDRPLMVADVPGVTTIPFRMTQNGLISIETEFDGSNPVNAILDSGASSTAISMAAVERLKMRDRIIQGQSTTVIGAAGIANNVELLFLRNCRVADLRQNNLRALVLDFDAINETSGFEQSGILGGDFLRHFRVTIDFPRTQVRFQPHATPQ
ncbi:MAG TPA: aspartyl protease family protein [Blastocatellia bacterium]|nr:aspartyl protease family protein [Blastocatellia bacterium]